VFIGSIWCRTYVGGVGGNVIQGTRGGDGDESLLELLGGKLTDGIGRVGRGLEGDVVGQQTSNVGRGHGGARDGVDGVLAADPGGEDVQAGSEDVSALSVVGEIRTVISQGGGTDSDGLLGGGGRVVASIGVVVASSDGEVDAGIDGSVNSEVKSTGATAAQTHVGNAALEALDLAILSILGLLDVSLSSPLNSKNDIGHGTGAVGAQHLNGVDVGLLGHTILLTSNSTRAVGAMAVAVLVCVISRDGLAPVGTALEINVVNVGAGVNHVGVNTLTALLGVQVLVVGTEGEAVPVGNTGQTPGSVLLNGAFHGVNHRVLLNKLNLLHGSVSVNFINLHYEEEGKLSYLHPDAGGPAQ